LVLLINDSEYSESAGAKPICLLAVFISFPWRALLLLWQLRIFAAAAARPHPTLPHFFGWREVLLF
jgi:hypothetical protein